VRADDDEYGIARETSVKTPPPPAPSAGAIGNFSAAVCRKSNQPVELSDEFSMNAINPRLFVNFISQNTITNASFARLVLNGNPNILQT